MSVPEKNVTPAPQAMRHNFGERMAGAALLHVDIYEEVEADTSATLEAAGVVALVAVASAIGKIHYGELATIASALATTIVGWLIWAGVTYLIGDKLLRGTATWGELLRTLGFAQGPKLLLVLVDVPYIGLLVQMIVIVWVLFTSTVALRQALDFSTARALVTGMLGLIISELLRLLA